jgi:hypothetical protein
MAQSGFWTSWKFRAASFWNDYVINFTASRQEGAIYFPVAEFFTSMKERFFDLEYWKTIGRAVLNRYAEVFRSLRQGEWHGSDLVLLGIPPLIVLTLGFIFYRLFRRVVLRMHTRRLIREQRQRLATVGFYLRFEKILQKIGLTRMPTETQREFARRSTADLATMAGLSPHLSQDGLPTQVAEAFYRVRYGNMPLSPAEADEINGILTRLEHVATGRTLTP